MTTLTFPVARTPIRLSGNFRIRLEPDNRQERRKFYAINSQGMFWTDFREIAKGFTQAEANRLMGRILAQHGKLSGRVSVVPA
jgi:hypothetical protein